MKKSFLDYSLKVRLPLTLFVALLAYIITFYVSRPERDGIGYKPSQPIAYSHKLHAGIMKIDCQYCHTGVTKERHALVPSTNICMNCHRIAKKQQPEIIKLTKYYEDNTPIPWKRIHKIPEYAYFNHSVHVNYGVKCETCHGNIADMDKVKQMKGWTMTACLNCHRHPEQYLPYIKNAKQGPTNCGVCHR